MAGFRHYLFGEFRLDARQRALFRQQEPIALTPKSLETLLFLVERHGQIVDKKEILEAVWPETFDKVARPRGRFQNSAVLQSPRDDNQNLSVFNGADWKVVFSPSQAKCVRL